VTKFYNKCPLCNSEKTSFFINTHDRHYGWINKHYDIFHCEFCGVLYLNPMISDSELFEMYPENNYYAYKTFKEENNLLHKLLSKIKRLLTFVPPSDLKDKKNFFNKIVLDLGCGSGKSLYMIKKYGAKEIYGVEISSKAAEIGNSYGLNIFNGTLIQAKFPNDYFDYIRSNHSFEHFTNPLETLVEIHRILKKGGKLFIGVPNTDSLMFRIFKKYWYYIGVPFHPFNYNTKCLRKILENNGFLVENVNYRGNCQGILGSVQIYLNRKNKKRSDEGLVSNLISEIIATFIARILNMLKIGDCIELVAVKK